MEGNMSTKVLIPVAALAFVVGAATGIAGSRSSLFARALSTSNVLDQAFVTPPQATLRSVLSDLLKNSRSFVLTGIEDSQGRCNVGVQAMAIRDDYMVVKPSNGQEWFLPFAAIYRVEQEGPGSITVPVVYTTAYPRPKFCGD
jgi:hypothetical protein